MPTVPTMQIPPPKTWQEFELIVRDALAIRWRLPSLTLHGRSGQAQQGVDVFGQKDGRWLGAQCKCQAWLALSSVEDEVAKAETFSPTLSEYHVAITGERDAALQNQVRALSDTRVKAGKFSVHVVFWEDIIGEIATSPAVLSKHYPTLFPLPPPRPADERFAVLQQLYASPSRSVYFASRMRGEIVPRVPPHADRVRSGDIRKVANMAHATLLEPQPNEPFFTVEMHPLPGPVVIDGVDVPLPSARQPLQLSYDALAAVPYRDARWQFITMSLKGTLALHWGTWRYDDP